ncbi:MAG TPA: adenylyltransferase/cytidyltransferase family protein [Candidatus Woesebacteria bacterium]|nr:adenylyltransferase/cytidyltransferase family protein [Candidatus Woesebacteria bacterium]
MKMNIWKYSDIETMNHQLEGKKIVLVGGCFDILHYGHLTFLQKAKQEGDILIVALESDQFIIERKKRKPVHTQKQRAELLANLHVVDYVVALPYFQSHQEYAELVQKIKPYIIAVTEEDTNLEQKKQHAKLVNAQIKTVSPLLSDFSTTHIMQYENISSN